MKTKSYFPHDSNARNDPKIVLMISQIGVVSYSIYWILIEILREQPGFKYPLILLPTIAEQYKTTKEIVNAIVYNYDLFMIEGDKMFLSPSLCRRMDGVDQSTLNGIKGSLVKHKYLTRQEVNNLTSGQIRSWGEVIRGVNKPPKISDRGDDFEDIFLSIVGDCSPYVAPTIVAPTQPLRSPLVGYERVSIEKEPLLGGVPSLAKKDLEKFNKTMNAGR